MSKIRPKNREPDTLETTSWQVLRDAAEVFDLNRMVGTFWIGLTFPCVTVNL